MRKFNLHSHSTFCDGKSSLEQMVLSAIDKGLYCFGFSAHAPVPFDNTFALQYSDKEAYLRECARLKAEYADRIRLFTSMEFDFITDIVEDARQRAEEDGLDYVIASVHQVKAHGKEGMWFIDGGKQETWIKGLEEVFGGNVRQAVECFYTQSVEMVQKVRPDIVGHFDKVRMHNRERFFRQTEAWYEELVAWFIEEVKKQDCICEVNTRGLYKGRSDDFFPSTKWIKHAAQKGVRMTISTDAHREDEVDLLFDEAAKCLKECGHRQVWYFDGQWTSQTL